MITLSGTNIANESDDHNWMMRKSFLESLFSGKEVVAIGVLAQSICCILFWHHTQDLFYIYLMGWAAIVGISRMIQIEMFLRKRDYLMSDNSTRREIERWYVYYMCGSSAAALFLGVLTGYSIYVYQDDWATVLSLALTLGTMVAAVGRNYGSNANVTLIVGGSFIPVLIAFLAYSYQSENYSIGIGGFTLLLIWATAARQMANAVHLKFAETQRLRHVAEVLQRQFFDAVSNMPNGLILVKKDGYIKFVNENIRTMFSVPSNIDLTNRSFLKLFDLAAKVGILKHDKIREFKARIERLFLGNSLSEILEFNDNFKVEFSVRAESPLDEDIHAKGEDGFVIVCEDVTQRLKDAETVLYSANYDKLSDIPNRRYLSDLIKNEINASMDDEWIALCVFDIDKFKTINDSFGHASGDEVIHHVADSMKTIKRMHPDTIISRLGGDEFVISLPKLSGTYNISKFFDEAFSIICKGYEIHGRLIDVKCSGGVYFCRSNEFQLSDAMRKADLALYKVKEMKKSGKDMSIRWALFDEELEQDYRNTQQMTHELSNAVHKKQISVRYQPMFSADGTRLETCEALCRWDHPELGLLSPDQFISIAESMNMISDITKEMIMTACKDCAGWGNETNVSVNLSVLDLAHYDIVSVVATALRESGLSPSRLQIEITESILLKDGDTARHILQTFNAMGVKTSIDDFGTGYANLSAIGNLPISRVKIDRSFIKNLATDEKALKFFKGVVGMISTIGLDVTVEGVETKEQLRLIQECDVSLLQGYYFGKPMPNSEIKEMINANAQEPKNNVVKLPNREVHRMI